MSDFQGYFSIYPSDGSAIQLDPNQLDAENVRTRPSPMQEIVSSKPVRFILFALGLFFLIWPFLDQQFRDPENNLTGLLCLPLSIGVGLLVAAFTAGGVWRRSGFWFALALVGQAVSLQLVNAGWQLRYQHYKPFEQILQSTLGILLLAFFVVQAAVVLVGLRPFLARIIAWCRQNLRMWQQLLIASVFIISTTTVSHSIAVYIQEWAFAVLIQTLSLATIVLAAMTIPQGSIIGIRRLLSALFGDLSLDGDVEPGRPDRFALSAAAFVTILAAVLCFYSYERHPHVPDEVAYLAQARLFASGAVTMPAPPVPEGFEAYLMMGNGNSWYPVPPPGWPIILTVGELFGLPWLVNPFLAGINVLLVYVLLRELYPKSLARISIFLLALSPWYIFLGMSFMTHMFSLTCALAAAVGVAWSRREDKAIWAWFGGLALGMISMVRPLEAVAVAGLLGLWAIGIGGKRLKAAGIAGLILSSMIVGGIGLAYNAVLTGNAAEFPINVYTDEHFGKNSNAYGFGADRGMGWEFDPYPGHGPFDALVNTNLNVSATNTELFGWSIGSFLLIAIGLCVGGLKRSDYLMLAVIAAIYMLHFFYYFSGGPDFGARYWFLMVVPLVVLAARGIQKLAARFDEQFEGGGIRVYAAVLALCLLSVITFIPWRAIDKYHNFRGMRPDIRYLADVYEFGRSLVLIQGNKHPDYDSAMIYNPLDLRANAPIYAWDRDSSTRKKLLAAYSDRPVWIVKAPSITKRGYEVAAGPLAAEGLLNNVE
jgi:hypothetical protein